MVRAMRVLPLVLLFAIAACSDGERRESSQPDTAGQRSWTVTSRGIGPVMAGMTVEETRAALGAELPEPIDSGCTYITPAVGPAGVRLMVVDGHVVRVDISDTTVSTSVGARVGDSEARVESLYRGRVQTTPHKYTKGHYLTVIPATPADSLFRLVFETDSGRVTSYRAGLLPMVEWVEGCS